MWKMICQYIRNQSDQNEFIGEHVKLSKGIKLQSLENYTCCRERVFKYREQYAGWDALIIC